MPADSEELVAQSDGAPEPLMRPTLTWAVPSETLVSDPFILTIPSDLPTGSYRLLIGIYDPYGGQRLTTVQGDRFLLADLTVTNSP